MGKNMKAPYKAVTVELEQKRERLQQEIEKLQAARDEIERVIDALKRHGGSRVRSSQGPSGNAPAVSAKAIPDSRVNGHVAGSPARLIARGMENTGEVAEQVFLRIGRGRPLKVRELVQHMRGMGWQGSGDARKDYRNVHTALGSRPHKYKNLGGMWQHIAKEDS